MGILYSTLFRKLFGTGEIKQDSRKSFLENGLWHIDPDVRSEDDDVREERCRVLENEFPLDSPLVLKRIRKEYSNGKLAVKDGIIHIYAMMEIIQQKRLEGEC